MASNVIHSCRSKDNFAVFLIKAAFWICVVIMLVPVDTGPAKIEVATQAKYSEPFARQAAGAARATVTDMASFCERNPDVCQTGTRVMDHFATKAAAVARQMFGMVSGSKMSPQGVAPKRATQPSNLETIQPQSAPGAALEPVRNHQSLLPSDRSAPWVGPTDNAV